MGVEDQESDNLLESEREPIKNIETFSNAYEVQVNSQNSAIDRTEKYSQSLLEASLDPIITIGLDGRINYVNAATEKVTGLCRNKLTCTDFAVYFTDSEKARAGYERVFNDGKVYDYELDIKNINGYSTPLLFNASIYKDDEGAIIGVLAVARDITKIKKIEAEHIFLKNNLELLIKQRAAELVIANKELVFQSGEKSDRAAELVEANKELVFQNIEKDKRAEELSIANTELAFQSKEKADRAAELVIANKELVFQNTEKDKRAAELTIANTELAFQSREKADRAAELVIANEELAFESGEKADRATELIKANKELVFQNTEKDKRAAELTIANTELAFQSREKANRAAELVIANEELAFESGEKANRATELITANKELVFQNTEKDKRAEELTLANTELAFQSKEKGKRAEELIVLNKELEFQKKKTKNLNDELEIRVKERTAQLESANIELESLSYSISHDLKAPLRHITGYVSLLHKKYWELLPDDGQHYLNTISESAKNMGELIDGLLQFSRTGKIEINSKLVNMNEIINSIIQPIIEQDTENRITFDIALLPSAYADVEMIKSVWNNIIENAVKFTQKRDRAIISIGSEETKDEIIYLIKDNGAGFDMQYATKLFAVFHRLHTREDYEGTGIGLATVKRIINRHGGKIWAESKADEGAKFYFSLNKRKESK